ncbi:MAG: hypothetical protein HS132_09780 [Planctomycetia bacterium]|nr:hypothetical protein [Planctomycetia bacterium]
MKGLSLLKVFVVSSRKSFFCWQVFSSPLRRGAVRTASWPQICCAAMSFLVALSSCAYGTATNMWTQSSESDFNKGITHAVSINDKGEIRLSPKIEAIPGIKGAFVWSMAADLQNRIFVGTGDPGTVYLIKDGSEAVEVFKSPELYIQSLTADNHGNLYAGTAPRGIIYKISNTGEATVFCSLPAPYIWDMSVDNNSNLFAVTGNEGILYKISPDGIPVVFFDSPETNLLDLLIDRYDNMYVSTEPNGLVYKITPAGQAQVLFDASEGEIHCLSMDSAGNIYAGTASGAQVQVPMAPAPQPPVQMGITTAVFKEEKSWDLNLPEELPMAQSASMQQQKVISKGIETPPKTTGFPTAPNYVYKITPDGLIQKLWKPVRLLSLACLLTPGITCISLQEMPLGCIKFPGMNLHAALQASKRFRRFVVLTQAAMNSILARAMVERCIRYRRLFMKKALSYLTYLIPRRCRIGGVFTGLTCNQKALISPWRPVQEIGKNRTLHGAGGQPHTYRLEKE